MIKILAKNRSMCDTMKILTIANVPPNPNSGASGTVWNINIALRKLGHRVDEIWEEQLGPKKIQHGNLHLILEQPQAFRREVMKATSRENYDVIVIDQPQAYLAVKALKKNGFQGLIVNRSHGIELRAYEIVSQWHRLLHVPENKFPRNLISPILRVLLKRQWPILVNNVDQFLVSTTLDREYLKKHLGVEENKIITLSQGMSQTYFETDSPSMSKERLQKLIFVGQPAFFKGVHILVKVVANLLQQYKAMTFTALTTPEGEEFFKASIPKSCHHRLFFPGWMNEKELIETLDEHGIFLFTSFFEGFGKAPFEAMARGLCIVVSDEGGMHDLVVDGQNGYLAEVGKVTDFTKKVSTLVNNDSLAKQISRNAIQTAKQLTWDQYATKLANILLDRVGNNIVV